MSRTLSFLLGIYVPRARDLPVGLYLFEQGNSMAPGTPSNATTIPNTMSVSLYGDQRRDGEGHDEEKIERSRVT
jgi:hypothetical protein